MSAIQQLDRDDEHEHRHSIASLRSKFESLTHGRHSPGHRDARTSVRPWSPTNVSSASASPAQSSAHSMTAVSTSSPPAANGTSLSVEEAAGNQSLSDALKRITPSSLRPSPPSLAPKPQLKPKLDSPDRNRTPSPTPSTATLSTSLPCQPSLRSPPSHPPVPSPSRAAHALSPPKPPETVRTTKPPSLVAIPQVPPTIVPTVNVKGATLEVDAQRVEDAEDDAPISVSVLRQRFGQAPSGPIAHPQPTTFTEEPAHGEHAAGDGIVGGEGTLDAAVQAKMGPPPVPTKPAHKAVARPSQPQPAQPAPLHSKGSAPPPPQSRSASRPASRMASPVPTSSPSGWPLSNPRSTTPIPIIIPTPTPGLSSSAPFTSSPQTYPPEPSSLTSTPLSMSREASPQPMPITFTSRRPAPPRPVSPLPQPVAQVGGPTPVTAPTVGASTSTKPPLPVRKATLPAGVIDDPPPLPSNKPTPTRSATALSTSSSDSNIFKPPLPGNKPSAPTVVPVDADLRPALPHRSRGNSIGALPIAFGLATPPPRLPARQATGQSMPTSYSSLPPLHRQRGFSISAEPGYVPPPPPPLRTAGQPTPMGVSRANTVVLGSKLDIRRANGGSVSPGRTTSGVDSDDDDEGPVPTLSSNAQRLLDEHPDSTYANQTPPIYGKKGTRIRPSHSITSFAVFGQYVAAGHHHVEVYDVTKSDDPFLDMDQKENTGLELRAKDPRVTALGFRPSRDPACEGRYLWCGNKDGHLWEIDIDFARVTTTKPGVHTSTVTHIMRHEYYVLTLDETGKLNVWEVPDAGGKAEAGNFRLFRTMRVSDRVTFAKMIKGKLWTATAPAVRSATTTVGVRGPTIRVYEPFAAGNAPPARTSLTPEWTGSATSATVVPLKSDLVYMGHEGGFVSLWKLAGTELQCVQVLKVSTTDILALEGVGDHLWAGNRRGQIHVWNIDQLPWTTSNMWTVGKDEPIRALVLDPRAIPTQHRLPMWSVTRDALYSWDGLRAVNWFEKRMVERQPDYCDFREIKVLVVSWNIDSAKPSDLSSGGVENINFLSQVLGSVDTPDIIVFGFQEVIPLTDKKLTAKTILFGSKSKDGATNERVSSAYRAWADKLSSAVRLAYPGEAYTKMQSEQLVGLFTCVFAKDTELDNFKEVMITTVKRGIGGIYGNKGAIVARMVLDDTSLCFINVHLAAGQRHKAARNADIAAIMENKETFPRSGLQWFVNGGNGEAILDHEMVVLNGDLNYRIDQRREVVETSIRSGDLHYLLDHDQLRHEMYGNHAFRLRTFAEAPINFPPTYKYDPGTDEYDSSEKRRIPAWCDRVLFTKSPRIASISYRSYGVNVSDHRPVSAGLACEVKSIDPKRVAVVRAEVEAAWKVYQEERLKAMAKAYAGWY